MPNQKSRSTSSGDTGGYDDGVVAEQIADTRRDMEERLVKSSAVYSALVDQMGKVYGKSAKKDGLDQKTRILIGLAMAVQNGSQSAVEWTMTRAINHGASDQMIRDAIDVALLNGGTFTISNARFGYSSLALRRRRPRGS
jgi:alkylhydroperoxidase/carboxymuconolactone decarboxylase family protein YurZ